MVYVVHEEKDPEKKVALNRIERHGLVLKHAAGRIHGWYGRKLLPLYHAGLLGRVSRNEAAQRADMRALRHHLGR